MSVIQTNIEPSSNKQHGFPWMHVIGYIASIVLTLGAFWLAMAHVLSFSAVLLVIVLLAVVQIFVQLFFFMHITEKNGPAYHVVTLAVGLVMTFAIIGGSLWIMAFNAQVS